MSDSFIFQQENQQLELKVDIYNINYEVNAEIVKRSKSLAEYSRFIGMIKANLTDGLTLEEAIREAIEYGVEHDIMKEFLKTHGTEVTNMLLSGWNMDEALAVSKEEGFEDGYEEGVEYGEQKKQQELIRAFSDLLTPEQIAEKLHEPVEYVLSVLNEPTMVCEAEIPYSVNIKEK